MCLNIHGFYISFHGKIFIIYIHTFCFYICLTQHHEKNNAYGRMYEWKNIKENEINNEYLNKERDFF